jgi:transposase
MTVFTSNPLRYRRLRGISNQTLGHYCSHILICSESRSQEAKMPGADLKQEAMVSYVSPEQRVPADHPLWPIREMVDTVLKEMSPRLARLYAPVGQPSIAPERLLQIFYSVRSERLLMEQLNYNLLFRWFVGMEMDERVWDHAVFSKNWERLLNKEIAEAFFQRILKIVQPYLSDEHFTVDGILIEAWASHKSFRPKDKEPGAGGGRREVDFHGEARSNDTHQSTTDPEVRLYKKSKGTQLPGPRADGKSQRTVGEDAGDAGGRDGRTRRRPAGDLGRRQEL